MTARTARTQAKVNTRVKNPNPNKEVVCWHCGKKRPLEYGMLVEQSGYGEGQHKGGTRKPKELHKGAASLEQRDQAAAVEQQPPPTLASSLDLASFETPGRSPHLDPEGWLRWTCGRIRHSRWMQRLAQKRRRMCERASFNYTAKPGTAPWIVCTEFRLQQSRK